MPARQISARSRCCFAVFVENIEGDLHSSIKSCINFNMSSSRMTPKEENRWGLGNIEAVVVCENGYIIFYYELFNSLILLFYSNLNLLKSILRMCFTPKCHYQQSTVTFSSWVCFLISFVLVVILQFLTFLTYCDFFTLTF